ncbi:MAG TPA: ribokinase, partial [Anaerolineaceae bacterium]|nr:ribokinase [Anaerolineaceae bacterium]
MHPKIVVIGSLNMDLVVQAPRIPQPGETLIGGRFRTAAGGKGANQAVAAARLGAMVEMVGCVGEDAYGRALKAGLEADKIDTHAIAMDSNEHTGVAIIIVEESGENSIVVSPGANWKVSETDIDRLWPACQDASIMVFQLEIPFPAVEHAINLAARNGIPVILNPAPA